MGKIKAFFMRVSEDGIPYRGYLGEIENTLEAMQKYVNFGEDGGLIQAVRLTDEIDMICNDEGKLKGFPQNRVWFYKGEPVDIICGNVMCVRHDMEGNFTSITEKDIPVIQEHLRVAIKGKGVMFSPPSDEKCPEWNEDV